MPQFPVQPAELYSAATSAGQTVMGTPTPYNAPSGVATCNDLFSTSPPMLDEEFWVYAYSIPAVLNAYQSAGFAAPPTGTASLQFFVNSDLAYSTELEFATMEEVNTETYLVASAIFSGDLVNPIRVGARERLNLKASMSLSEATTGLGLLLAQSVPSYSGTSITYQTAPASVSYNTRKLAGRRRL